MSLRQAAQQALEALVEINKLSIGEHAICLPGEIDTAMEALRAALAEPWVGLTDEEILAEMPVTEHIPITSFARAIEAKLKEKNT